MGWILRRFTVVFSFKESSVVKSDERVSDGDVAGCSFCPASAKQHVYMFKNKQQSFQIWECICILGCSISQSAGSESWVTWQKVSIHWKLRFACPQSSPARLLGSPGAQSVHVTARLSDHLYWLLTSRSLRLIQAKRLKRYNKKRWWRHHGDRRFHSKNIDH